MRAPASMAAATVRIRHILGGVAAAIDAGQHQVGCLRDDVARPHDDAVGRRALDGEWARPDLAEPSGSLSDSECETPTGRSPRHHPISSESARAIFSTLEAGECTPSSLVRGAHDFTSPRGRGRPREARRVRALGPYARVAPPHPDRAVRDPTSPRWGEVKTTCPLTPLSLMKCALRYFAATTLMRPCMTAARPGRDRTVGCW